MGPSPGRFCAGLQPHHSQNAECCYVGWSPKMILNLQNRYHQLGGWLCLGSLSSSTNTVLQSQPDEIWKIKNIYQSIPVLKPLFVLDDILIKHKQPFSVDSAICEWDILTNCKYGGFCGYVVWKKNVSAVSCQALAFLMCNTDVALSIPAVRQRLGASNMVPRYCHHVYFLLFYRNQGCFHRRPAKTPRSAGDLVW